MKDTLILVILLILVVLGVWTLSRLFWKAGLHELDSYLNKKFNNHTKLKKDGKKEEK